MLWAYLLGEAILITTAPQSVPLSPASVLDPRYAFTTPPPHTPKHRALENLTLHMSIQAFLAVLLNSNCSRCSHHLSSFISQTHETHSSRTFSSNQAPSGVDLTGKYPPRPQTSFCAAFPFWCISQRFHCWFAHSSLLSFLSPPSSFSLLTRPPVSH